MDDSSRVAAGMLRSGGATAPDRFVIARWPGINGTTYDYNIDSSRSITSDSAYAVYWNEETLAPGEARSYVTLYGLAEVTADLRPPLALTVSAPNVLTVESSQYSPNPFDVTATVLNNGTAPATNVQVTLNLTGTTGLTLDAGSATQTIGDLAVGAEEQVSWRVQATPQNQETTITYAVQATADNTDDKTVGVATTLPALNSLLRITDTAGNDVSALALNDDGWPALNADTDAVANPITVTVTLRCPEDAATACDDAFSFTISSDGDQARFLPYATTFRETTVDGPSNVLNCVADPSPTDLDQNSYTAYTAACSSVSLSAGSTLTFTWSLWIQPSEATELNVITNFNSSTVEKPLAIPQAQIHPVVFVHGILGSMPPTDELITSRDRAREVFDPFIGSYWPLLDNLEKMGYQWNKTLFGITYDWRQSNKVSGRFLGDQLDTQIIPRSHAPDVGYVQQDGKADLLVHSMGGLVSRAYVQGVATDDQGDAVPYNENVRKLVFIATPHQGFPFNYRTWEGMTWSDYLYNAPTVSGGNLPLVNGLTTMLDQIVWPTLVTKRYDATASDLEAHCLWFAYTDPMIEEFTTGALLLGQTLVPGRDSDGNPGIYVCVLNTIAGWAHGVPPDAAPLTVPDPTRAAWSLHEMLPTSGLPVYLVNDDGVPPGTPTDWPWGVEVNGFLHALNANIERDLGDRLGANNIYVLYGNGAAETDQRYEVDPPPGGNLWRHGQVREETNWLGEITYSNIIQEPDGDDLIPTNSTTLFNSGLLAIPPGNEREMNAAPAADQGGARHKEIMYQPETQQVWVPRFLGVISDTATLPFTTNYVAPLVNAGTGLSIITACPINLLITDPQGRRLGYDPATGQVLREIPNAIYTSPDLEPQIVYLAEPLPGSYTLTASGYDQGDYLIRADQIAGDAVSPRGVFLGETVTGQQDTFTIMFDPDIPAVSPAPEQRATAGVAANLDLGGFRTPVPAGPWTVAVDWGDGTQPLSFTTSVTGTLGTHAHTYAADGNYRVAVTVTDVQGRTGAAAFPVVVTGNAPAPGNADLAAQYRVGESGDTSATNSDIKPFLNLINNGTTDIPLSELTVRYWYTIDTDQPQTYTCDWAVLDCANITHQFVPLTNPRAGADHYLELGFTSSAGTLPAGGSSGDIQSRITKTDFSSYDETDDYSFDPTKTSYTDWTQITLYRNGVLVWGTEPAEAVSSDLALQYRVGESGGTSATNSDIKPVLNLVNNGTTDIPLSELTVRYWYTIDSEQSQSYACDWAVVNCANITHQFVPLSSPRDGADHYLELGFTSSAGTLPGGGSSGDIQSRITKTDFSSYDETDDYSFDPTKTSFTDWTQVTLYRNGVLIWGTEPN